MMADPTSLALAALLLPLAAFLSLALLPALRRRGRMAGIASAMCALGAFAAALAAWRATGIAGVTAEDPARVLIPWLPSASGPLATIGVVADPDSTVMLMLVALVALLVQVYSLEYLHEEPAASLGRYYAYQSLFAFSMMGLVLAPNLLQLFICWELVGLCSYLLIGFWYRKPEAARAAIKAFWTTKAGDVGLLIGIVLLWRQTGTFDLVELRQMAESGAIPIVGLSFITFCMYLGAAGKSAQVPFHIWLPDAMEGPTPVSALIHAATMVTAGVYLLFRTSWLFALTPDVLAIVCWVGAITAMLAAILACVQSDIKRVLAYSTVSQLGYMMSAIGAGFAAAGFFHLLTHGIFKALLFLGAGAVIHAVGSNDIGRMGGLARRMPQTAAVFIVGTLSLAGIPFFAGFLSKEEILGAVFSAGQRGPFVLLVLAAFLTAFYMFRVIFVAFFGSAPAVARAWEADRSAPPADAHGTPLGTAHEPAPAHAHEPVHAHDAPWLMTGPLWLLALASLAIGLTTTLRHGAEPGVVEPPLWLTPLAVAVAASGILLAWLTYQRRAIDADRLAAVFGPVRRAALAGFGFDAVALGLYHHALLAGARMIGWTDRYIVDGVLNVVSAWTVSGGDQLRQVQTGRVQDYAYAVGVGLLMILIWMGWSL
jgi:NADH-quinone oxidoreductase subunit L